MHSRDGREHDGAVAYLPKGLYRTTGTLEVGGAGWTFRGCGISSVILYDGNRAESANLIAPVFFGTTVLSEGPGTLSVFGGWGDLVEVPRSTAPTAAVGLAFDDLTRLGELDLALNYRIAEGR